MRVAVQHQKRFLREGLALLLERDPDVTVAVASTAPELVELCALLRPDVVVLDADVLHADPSPVAALFGRFPTLRVIAFGGAVGRQALHRARQSGVVLVPEAAGLEAVMAAVRADRPPPHHPFLAQPPRLTSRQADVLALVGAGWTSQEISDRLSISRKTVESHKQAILGRLGVPNQATAVAEAIRMGMLSGRPVPGDGGP